MRRYPHICFVLLLLAFLLTSCSTPLTYTDTQATARAGGCWPDSGYPTPNPVTVTPIGNPTATPLSATPDPLLPTVTTLPTTTPLPRCPAAAGATLVPWPTAVPNPPAFPTRAPYVFLDGGALQTTLQLPVNVLTVDIATHPTENWPAVASVVWSGNQDPERVMVSVLNPNNRAWSFARQVDLGQSRIGRYSRTVNITITTDRTIVVVWAMSDPNFITGDPPTGVWSSVSHDFGVTWSAPERIATHCSRVAGLATADDNRVVALLVCDAGPTVSQPVMVIRGTDGRWATPQPINAPIWRYSEGAIVISDTQVIATVLGAVNGTATAYVISGSLQGDAWSVGQQPISSPAGNVGERMWHVRGLAYTRPDGSTAITFLWTGADAQSGVYGMTSLDGGFSWNAVETLHYLGVGAPKSLWASPFYDPAADRLIAIIQCCADASWVLINSTHIARWSIPGSGVWRTPGGESPDVLVPLANGSRGAADTVTAQSHGVRVGWLAWKDSMRRVEVRSVDFNQLVPIDQYPLATLTPAPQP